MERKEGIYGFKIFKRSFPTDRFFLDYEFENGRYHTEPEY